MTDHESNSFPTHWARIASRSGNSANEDALEMEKARESGK
jgi:hypothetical protein